MWSTYDELQVFIDASGGKVSGGSCQAIVSGEVVRVCATSMVAMILWGKSLRVKGSLTYIHTLPLNFLFCDWFFSK